MMRVAVLALALLIATPALAADYKAPRNAFGQPDLEGVWNTDFVMPLEAEPGMASLTLPEAEARAFARKVATDRAGLAAFAIDPEVADLAERAAEVGLGKVRGEYRTRELVQPADGKLPLAPRARAMVSFVDRTLRTTAEPPLPTDNPESRPNWERCVVGQGQPPIAITTSINPRQILQTKDAVVILSEYGPDLRIIPFAPTHGPKVFDGPLGDSIARWEGDTLVIETVRMPAKDQVRPLPTFLVPASAVVEERYTRLSPTELLYQFTVRDPAVYTGPWLAEYSLTRTKTPIYEFACHEGNYSLPNILAGARAAERARARP
jgi:hypothetical protein